MRRGLILWGERLGRWALALIFLAAALPKIMDPSGFASDISHYAMLPDVVINPLAVVLPWIEAVAALALLSGFAAEGAVLLTALMLAAFLGGLGQAWIRGLDIDCGCFGHSDARGNVAVAFARDTGFLLLAGLVLFLRRLRNRPVADAR